jgi:hypothetical protein
VGKTTLLRHILHRLPERSAILDGDDLARIHPFRLSTEWLDLVQDNLLACAENLAALDLKHLLLAFVFPSRGRIERLNRIFAARGHTLHWINLVAADDSLEARLRQRGVTGEDILGSAREMNAQIRGFEDMPCIDTTDMDIETLADRVLEMIE